jgi:hypothetical protein
VGARVNVLLVQVSPATVFCLLVFGHALADYPLQGDFLARGKNRNAPIPGVPWWICLSAHAVIHAGLVGLCTGSLALGLAEFFIHSVIDLGSATAVSARALERSRSTSFSTSCAKPCG